MEKLLKYSVLPVFFLLLHIADLTAQALDPPTFGCIRQAADGLMTSNDMIELSWTPPADPGATFTQYDIYTSANAGAAFSYWASAMPYATTTYSQLYPVAATNNQYFFMQTLSSDGAGNYTSVNSDTLTSVFLEVSHTVGQPGDSSAYLDWNSPFLNDNSAPPGLEYEIWMQYPANTGPWTFIQSLPFGVTNWIYEVTLCQADINFQVRLTVGSCQFISNIDGDHFADKVKPIAPVISSVSVDPVTNDAVIEWQASVSEDTFGYQVYRFDCNTGVDVLIGTTTGGTLQFIDLLAQPSLGSLHYHVAAVDTCGTPSPTTNQGCINSVFLTPVSYTACDQFSILSWSPYAGWEAGVDYYIIYYATTASIPPGPDAGAWAPLDTVPASDLDYTHLTPSFNQYNWYYIEAVSVNDGFRAKSNAVNRLINYPVPPEYVYLGSASVLSLDSVNVMVEIFPTPETFRYTLERYDVNGVNWDEIIILDADNVASLDMPDGDATTDVFSYTYRVITENECGEKIDTTNLGKTILLDGISNQQRILNTLVWSPYGDWENGVSVYRIHRVIGDTGIDEVIAEVNSGAEKYYEDDVSALFNSDGKFCYWIEAVEITPDLPFAAHTSISNELCLSLDPVIWIPNSFIVDGYNRTFAPVISFADFTSFRMIVYSRWGDIIYETTDINAPWDGSMNGKTVQEGTYTYYISVKDGKGKIYDATGYVVMLVDSEK